MPALPPPTTYTGPPDSSEREPLLENREANMGQEEQQLKPEARKGDTLAKYAALVSTERCCYGTYYVLEAHDLL
jgi:hypothetical protein